MLAVANKVTITVRVRMWCWQGIVPALAVPCISAGIGSGPAHVAPGAPSSGATRCPQPMAQSTPAAPAKWGTHIICRSTCGSGRSSSLPSATASELTALPRTKARIWWPWAVARESGSRTRMPAPSDQPVPLASAVNGLQRPSGASRQAGRAGVCSGTGARHRVSSATVRPVGCRRWGSGRQDWKHQPHVPARRPARSWVSSRRPEELSRAGTSV
jgi:hypothetical protein